MLIFELTCNEGHEFEGWFDSLTDLDRQVEEGKLHCPICGSQRVKRVFSAFAIGGRSRRDNMLSEPGVEQSAQVVQQAVHRYLMENFEDVGVSFFKEALKMHYGATPVRNIRGISSSQEEEILREEGVEFFKFADEEQSQPVKPNARKQAKLAH